ncbi:MAG: acylphosphatase [Candidatus Bathyarchaeota archaeon]|nr:acylphosphatase [Candidatus Bathyarchaeota archaeon]
METRAHVFVSGKVQGVFFRSATKQKAELYGVKGWIRNLADGRVEAIFEGEEEAVKAMIEFCKHGPPTAVVTKVDVWFEEPTGEYTAFKVKQT